MIMNRNNKWFTEICGYQGHVYTREVGPSDTTVYMDYVYDSIQWLDSGPNNKAVEISIKDAEALESAYDEMMADTRI